MRITMDDLDELIGPIEINGIGRGIEETYVLFTACEGRQIEHVKSILDENKIKFKIIPTDCIDCFPNKLYEVRITNKAFLKRVLNYEEQFIYFIRSSEGFVKIGLSNNPEKRLKTLQTASPYKLDLAYKMKGNESLEKYLHLLFAPYRAYGEWFQFSDAIIKFIQYQFIPKEFCKKEF